MNYYALFPTISSLILLTFCIYLYFKHYESHLSKIFTYLCVSYLLWIFPLSLIYWIKENNLTTFFLYKLSFLGLVFFPVILFHFLLVFLKNKFVKYINYLYYLSSFLFFWGFFTNSFFNGLSLKFWGYYPVAGKFLFILILQFLILLIIDIYILHKYLGKSELIPIKKEQFKYFIFAFYLLVFIFVDYSSMFAFVNIYPFGYIFILFFFFITSFSMLKTDLTNFDLAFVNISILVLLYFFIFTIPFIIQQQTGNLIFSLLVLLIMSLLGPHVFYFLKKKAEKIILEQQENYQKFLLSVSKLMYKEQNISTLSKLIVRLLNKTVKIKFSALFIYSKEDKYYYCISQRGEHIKKDSIKINEDTEIINSIKMKMKPFLLNNNSFTGEKNLFDAICDDISLVVPIKNINELAAFIVMGNKNNGSLYSKKDLEVFKILSDEAYFAIENCNFFNKVNNQQYHLLETDKLTKIGQMANGFANQLKNRLHQFYLVGEGINYELNSFKSNNDDFLRQNDNIGIVLNYVGQIADSIVDDVKKTNNVLQNILNFSKTNDQNIVFTSFSLRHIIEQSLHLLKIKHQKEKIPLILHLPAQDEIYGIRNQIQRVFFNCLDNAYDAIIEKQKYLKKNRLNIADYIPNITIELKYINKNAKIYIHDNGIGIKDENINKIFSIFFTTKLSGERNSGMGLYIVKEIITKHHEGTIEFKSKYGYGTTFLITLPLML